MMPFSNRPYENHNRHSEQRSFRPQPDLKRGGNNTRPAPPDATNAENFYYLKQMSSRTPMVIVLTDGEQIHGCIEWYDRTCLKVNREGAPNLLIQKQVIKYMFKADEL